MTYSSRNEEIVFATLRMTPPFFLGGAEVSQRILAEKLSAKGFRVCCIGSYAHPVRNTWERLPEYCEYLTKHNIPYEFNGEGSSLSYSFKGISCIMLPQENVMEKLVEKSNEEIYLVFTWLEHSDEIIKYCNENKINTVTWIHDVLSVGLSSIQAKPKFVLFTSDFVRQRVEDLFSQDGFVFYPPFDFTEVDQSHLREKQESKIITLINPIHEKGINIFLELSTFFKDFTFFAVEGWRPVQIDEKYLTKNVRYIPRQFDLTSVYKQTDILLAPSHFEEGFGRVVVEAGLHGVPSIVSNRGGLKEAVGNGGIVVDSFDTADWIEAIKTIVDPNNYQEFCTRAKEHGNLFLRDPVSQLVDIGIL